MFATRQAPCQRARRFRGGAGAWLARPRGELHFLLSNGKDITYLDLNDMSESDLKAPFAVGIQGDLRRRRSNLLPLLRRLCQLEAWKRHCSQERDQAINAAIERSESKE